MFSLAHMQNTNLKVNLSAEFLGFLRKLHPISIGVAFQIVLVSAEGNDNWLLLLCAKKKKKMIFFEKKKKTKTYTHTHTHT